MKLSGVLLGVLVATGCTARATESATETEASSLLTVCNGGLSGGVSGMQIRGRAVTWPQQNGIADVEFCVELRDGTGKTCTTTDTDGNALLSIIACQDLRVTYTKSGFLAVNQLNRVGTAPIFVGTRMLTTAQAQQIAASMGHTYDPSKALPIITTWDAAHNPLGGVSVVLSPSSGVPWYLDNQGRPSTTLSATAGYGIMGFAGVNPGLGQVKATVPGRTCTTPEVTGDGPSTGVIEAFAGSIAEVAFICE